eukprot:2975243-Pleurochrysis_carterae.AAC.1
MAHVARVLRNEKVIRMHYANCNTYNADFDGDEMNLHMCQSELARAEAYGIAATDEQYIVPTNGKPLRGLIQDHVVMGVLLTKKDTFLCRSTFMQLLYLSGLNEDRKGGVQVPPPTLLKPEKLWTGKQLISTLLLHLHYDARSLAAEWGTKTAADAWAAHDKGKRGCAEEGRCVVRGGELMCGVLDKSAFGASEYGMVHAVHELLGGAATGLLLSQLGRLLTGYQQMHGHTCGIADLILTEKADLARNALLASAHEAASKAARAFAKVEDDAVQQIDYDGRAGRHSDKGGDAKLREALCAMLAVGEGRAERGAELDNALKGALMPVSSDAVAECLPKGQAVPFPRNSFALMTATGAKGSMVNFSQISVMLGQQELEGRRVPLSPSGATAPCFLPYDLSARAGGYITDRFLTGVRPPEFYFHCMAGREGLVDTAVKTSRSGYLQRCLIKHLEPLSVAYDHTVRSSVDKSVVQFVAGEDGLDPTKVSYLQNASFFAMNTDALLRKWTPKTLPKAVKERLSGKAAHKRRAERARMPKEQRPIMLAEVRASGREGR